VFLLDTDTCIDVLRSVAAVVEKLEELSPDDCAVSSISAFELYAGVYLTRHSEREKRKVDKLLNLVTVVAFDRLAAQEAARLRSELGSTDMPIGPYDLLIAAQALRSKCTLVTANVREFSRIESLKLESWR
jgi:tRNA(fMet)-specific endonuclease VapC